MRDVPERILDVRPDGMRRQSEVATALSLIWSGLPNPKRRRASLAAALHILCNQCNWWYIQDALDVPGSTITRLEMRFLPNIIFAAQRMRICVR